MKVYYVGNLIPSDDPKDRFWKKSYDSKNSIGTIKLDRKSLNLTDEEFSEFASLIDKLKKSKIPQSNAKLHEYAKNIDFNISTYYQQIIYELVEDGYGQKYGKEFFSGLLFPIGEFFDCKYFCKTKENGIVLEKELTLRNAYLAYFFYALRPVRAATLNDIYLYEKKHLSQDGTIDYFVSEITNLYNNNAFNREIILKEKKDIQKQNKFVLLMEDIEYLLTCLKQQNLEIYNKYNNEYEKINSDCINSLNKIDDINLLNSLTNLRANIKLYLLINEKKCSNVIDYLNLVIEEHLNKFLNNIEFNIEFNIEEINDLYSIFLNDKNNYDYQEQREILRKLSLLYFLSIKNNIDCIDVETLNEGYFKDNIKSILISIYALKDIELIKELPDLNSYDNLSVCEVYNLIKDIKFNTEKKDNIQLLLKK